MVSTRVIEKRRTTPVLCGTSGDSTANTQSSNTDTSLVDVAFPGSGATTIVCHATKWQTHVHYPRARLVANGGVSGDSTTQWLARDSAGAGATRKAITDVLNLKVDAVSVSVGINDVTGVTSGTRAAAVATAIANIKTGLARLAMGCSCVMYRPIGAGDTATVTDLTQTRLACVEINEAIADFITDHGAGRMFYLDAGVVATDGSMATVYTYDGIHISWAGQFVIGRAEAAVLTRVFGISDRRRFDGVNLLTNQVMAASSTAGGYGAVATGVSINVTNATRQNATIEPKYGHMFQTVEIVPSATGAQVQMVMPYDPTALGIAANDYLGFEFDWFVEGVSNGTTPVLSAIDARVDTYKSGAGRVLLNELVANTGVIGSMENGAMFGHCSFPLWRCQEASAALTNASYMRLVANTDAMETFRIGVGNWRMVKANQALVTA